MILCASSDIPIMPLLQGGGSTSSIISRKYLKRCCSGIGLRGQQYGRGHPSPRVMGKSYAWNVLPTWRWQALARLNGRNELQSGQ